MHSKISASFEKLKTFCEAEDFKGYDPYDGLTSRLFQSLPGISKSRFFKLAWIQFFKRSPLNLRTIVGIQKDYNPKALGLFISAYCKLQAFQPSDANLKQIHRLTELVLERTSKGYRHACWGYNFDWQSRAFFQPAYTPTVVATTFVANALLDAYEITKSSPLLDAARSACDFILKDLNRTFDEDGSFCFSYSPLDKSVVYNASLLGSRLLARVYHYTHEDHLILEAKKSVVFCCKKQKADGSWAYGDLPFHQWIDNFHTGYNLECLADYMKYSGDNAWTKHLEKGYDYYINTFFTEEGICRYYSNSTYPIDIHAPTQLIITLEKLGRFHEQKELAEKVLLWTIDHMQSPKGYFHYQINRFFTSKIPYMRWAQAWMFLALSTYLLITEKKLHDNLV